MGIHRTVKSKNLAAVRVVPEHVAKKGLLLFPQSLGRDGLYSFGKNEYSTTAAEVSR